MKNKVQLIGKLGQTPEIKTFAEGRKMARFSVATNESWKDANGNWVKDTQWHNVVAWGQLAEQVEKCFDKGTDLAMGGKLINRSYETKDGSKRYVTEIVLGEFLVIGNGKKSAAEAAA